ncbi:MAG: hypothetical protein RI972_1831 [Pseudomonadota bacterium]
MSVSVGPEALLALLACAGYGLATLRGQEVARLPSAALVAGWLLHGAALAVDISGWGTEGGARFGFAPALSGAVWLVLAVHAVESRFVPLPGVRRALAAMGVIVSGLIVFFPGEVALKFSSPLTPLHLLLGIASYGLFGAAVIHGVMLDSAERALRRKPGAAAAGSVPGSTTGSTAPFTATPALGPHPTLFGLPLMRLERLTFRFVEAGFVVLSLALLMGWLASLWGHAAWRWDHKTVFSLLGWATFAALIAGRHLKGWRGRRATRWLYAGAGLLVLAYIGSRFVAEVVLNRVTPT